MYINTLRSLSRSVIKYAGCCLSPCRYSGLSTPKARKKGDPSSSSVVSAAGPKRAEFQPLTTSHHQPQVLPQLCVRVQPSPQQPIHPKQCRGALFPLSGLWKGTSIIWPLFSLAWRCVMGHCNGWNSLRAFWFSFLRCWTTAPPLAPLHTPAALDQQKAPAWELDIAHPPLCLTPLEARRTTWRIWKAWRGSFAQRRRGVTAAS